MFSLIKNKEGVRDIMNKVLNQAIKKYKTIICLTFE